MKYIIKKMQQFDELILVPLGDIHFGAKTCNMAEVNKKLDFVRNHDNARLLLMGDLIEVGSRDSPGSSLYQQTEQPQEQYEWMLDTFEEFGGRIDFSCDGNHEKRVFKSSGINVMKNFCRSEKITYVETSIMCHYRLSGQSYTVFATHGSSGSKMPHTKLNAIMKSTEFIHGCDIYFMGHMHSSHFAFTEIIGNDKKNHMPKKEKMLHMITGHYLDYDESYAEDHGMKPDPVGAHMVVISGKKHSMKVRDLDDFE